MNIQAGATGQSRSYLEKIGDSDWRLEEIALDVDNDVALWSLNPRLQTLVSPGIHSEAELEEALRRTNGYDNLKRSIDDLGQMEPIYVWRPNAESKFLVLEGATRVCILRELNRKHTSGLKLGSFRLVRAKVLPPDFGQKEQAILLARIHVRGTGVRAWGRYIEAKFIHENVVDRPGQPALMNQAQMARYMEKSEAWVGRLKSAYEFALKFVEYVDDEGAQKLAGDSFSVLEEISKARVIGSQLREYNNSKHDQLRADVFDMVRNEVFQEYRDARFLKEFHDDPDKWDQLKSGQKHIAHRLALDVRTNESSLKTKIAGIPQQIRRSFERGETDFGEDDVDVLQQAINAITDRIHEGVRPFRIALKRVSKALSEASMADVKELSVDELREFREAKTYFDDLLSKHASAA